MELGSFTKAADALGYTQSSIEIKGLETGIIRVGTISSIICHRMPAVNQGGTRGGNNGRKNI